MAGARRHSIQWSFISPCHPGHSPLTQLSAPLLSGTPPPLDILNLPSQDWCIPAGHSAWVVPPPSCSLWLEEGKGRKMQRGPLTARSTMWALMLAAWMWCLPATDPYGCHSPAAQQPGEDVSLTCHLDWTDKHWRWTDLSLTHWHEYPTSYWRCFVLYFTYFISWLFLIHSSWTAYTQILRINTNTHPNSYLHE